MPPWQSHPLSPRYLVAKLPVAGLSHHQQGRATAEGLLSSVMFTHCLPSQPRAPVTFGGWGEGDRAEAATGSPKMQNVQRQRRLSPKILQLQCHPTLRCSDSLALSIPCSLRVMGTQTGRHPHCYGNGVSSFQSSPKRARTTHKNISFTAGSLVSYSLRSGKPQEGMIGLSCSIV